MADPAIEHTGLRYVVSLVTVLVIVLVAIGVLVALPSSIPYEGAVTWVVVLLATVAALEVMGCIENGVSPIRERLP